MWTRVLCGLWLVLLLLSQRLWAFNVDTENVLRKDGDPKSLFGFSLAMHRQLQPEDKRMLLVGAPRAKAWLNQKSQVTGGLYKCDMNSDSRNCERIEFDNGEDEKRESKENQWMGVRVSSQGPGGKIVTCAHRYQRRANVNTDLESRDIHGRCYVMSQDLTINPRPVSEDGGDWIFCENRARGHEMFGSCQQGLSATFTKDYHYLIFGAPGAYNWKGEVRLEQKNDTLFDLGIFVDGPYETGDENEKNPMLVPVPASSYLGFSLDSGKRLTKKNQLTVVAGAPRAGHSGAVLLLKKDGDTSKSLSKEYMLEGEGLASSFGYDLAVLDFNGDSWEDIVVGAPQYFEKDKDIGGAVYIYVNKAGNWKDVIPIRIDGAQDSMFGLAVANLGDINQDTYDDFAVGAPYEDNKGAVYIYHGSANGLISKKHAQILTGPKGVQQFGYSLAGNMDLDKNSYPDLAVGSLSDSVFVYKARPVINMKREITFSPTEIDFSKKNCGNEVCLEVQACLTYTAKPESYTPRLTLKYSLEADADYRKTGFSSRASFSPDRANAETKGDIVLSSQGVPDCRTHKLYIKEGIREKLKGIPIDLSVEIEDGSRKRRESSSQLSPVLDANEPVKTRSEVNFLKQGCGTDNTCQSNLQLKYRYGYTVTGENKFTPLNLVNGVPVVSLTDPKHIVLEITVTNQNGDDAYEARVNASFPRSLTYSDVKSPSDVSCIPETDGSGVVCDMGNPFKRNTQTTFYVILSTAGISLNTTQVEIDLQLTTTSEQPKIEPIKAMAKVIITMELSLTGLASPSQVQFTGEVKGESAMKRESDIGSAITHQFTIINVGKRLTDLGTASLVIHWPKETAEGKWLLYLMNISAVGVDQLKCLPKGVINPRNIAQELSNRKKRATENTGGGDEGIISLLKDGKKTKTLACGNGAKCVEIRCPLKGLDSNAIITLKSRLWSSTLLEDYSSMHHVEVMVKASLVVDGTVENMVLQNADAEVRVLAFPERHEARHGRVPWWIIVLSILLALMLLALLAFLLWKCGVFGKKDKAHPSEKETLTSDA
ncbi:integrin alpha-6-like [Thalassophryne amazonica]|uniref:integrin alpha-6-like n=1 Tax=Thalassophryne amazonica TaxID=390379 RepID=UPI001471C623|nr:integrin alpha-6-like [Thalassophryne amazonica]